MTDIFFSIRSLARAPLLSGATVLTIAVAIAGTVAVFALLDSVVLRALPYEDAKRTVAVWVDMTELADEVRIQDPRREWTGLDNFRDLRAQSRTLADVAAFGQWTPAFRGGDGTHRIPGAAVTWSGLNLLGVRPIHGRLFVEAEGEPGSELCTVVITERFWHRHFAGDPGIVGQDLLLTGETCTVVGVLPASFRFPFVPAAEVITTVRGAGNDRGSAYLRQFGRLTDGISIDQAQAELNTIAASLRSEYPEANRGQNLFVEPLQEALNQGIRQQLIILQAAAVFVLLIAVANLASLMVARALSRASDFGVRAALGASRWRRFRLLLTEGLILALVGAAAGMMLAAWGVEALTLAFPVGFGDIWDVRISAGALLVAVMAALLAAAAMATLSFLALERSQGPASAIGGTRVFGNRGGRKLAGALVASNFAVALVVVVTGLLLWQSYQRLADVDPGFGASGVVAGMLTLPAAQFSDNYGDDDALRAAYDRLISHIDVIPGVEQSGLASAVPFGQANNDTFVSIEGRPQANRQDGRAHVWLTRADEGYFDAMGIRVLEGRAFRSTDRGSDRRVAMVNAAFVRHYLDNDLGGNAATGIRIATGPDSEPTWWDIIGVTEDVRAFNLARPATPSVYLPSWQAPTSNMYVVARTPRDPLALLPDLLRAISEFDPDLALTDVIPMNERVDAQLMVPRTVSRLTLLFALTALLLAAIGVYGTLAQSVVRRRREFGVRRALGAGDRDIVSQVVRQGLAPVLVGLAIGVPLTVMLGNRLGDILHAVSPLDLRVWLLALASLLSVAAGICFMLGRRAVRALPMQALRNE